MIGGTTIMSPWAVSLYIVIVSALLVVVVAIALSHMKSRPLKWCNQGFGGFDGARAIQGV
jgi:hypothetical protein